MKTYCPGQKLPGTTKIAKQVDFFTWCSFCGSNYFLCKEQLFLHQQQSFLRRHRSDGGGRTCNLSGGTGVGVCRMKIVQKNQIFIYWYFLFSPWNQPKEPLITLPVTPVLAGESVVRGKSTLAGVFATRPAPSLKAGWVPVKAHSLLLTTPERTLSCSHSTFFFFWTVLKTLTEETIATNLILICSDVTT